MRITSQPVAIALQAAVLLAILAERAPADDGEAAPGAQPWSIVLRQQAEREKACSGMEILSFEEMKIGDTVMLQGKISCLDGRQYDFVRRFDHQKFELRLCEPTVC